jgi:sigma54-dependent transcription regulator
LRSGHEALTFLLFSASRGRKATTNDADRLRKYLNRFGIEWAQILQGSIRRVRNSGR